MGGGGSGEVRADVAMMGTNAARFGDCRAAGLSLVIY